MLRRYLRPHSAGDLYVGGSYRRSGKGRKGGKDGDVLYKVAVTTGNVKNAGTDAKVSKTQFQEQIEKSSFRMRRCSAWAEMSVSMLDLMDWMIDYLII
jgi:hypothetical protein